MRVHPNCRECGYRYRWQKPTKEDSGTYWWCPRCGETEGASPLEDPKLQDYGIDNTKRNLLSKL